ncbi:methyltransferase domain-containing protein [Bacillus lacus]|uniref:Methyltransferase domain-containing protein n=1 Tax=Metabacillus lacus TaxID=1983721 RepID=A0A7X2LZ09_9BACI|nr:class I SAM-dependent methyltransferase [Metabacillus lacus]MRX71194.1 methyltransferase domain-containing protein [Metabacillus lacus]
MEWTGERLIPEMLKPTNGMLLEHVARYYFATPYAGERVLDIACGTGYGSHMVAKHCKREIKELIGVDIDPEAVTYANRQYHHQKITFLEGNAMDPQLPERLGQFDTILCFETIEHVEDDRLVLENLYKMLKPGGTLVISTPFGRGRGIPTNEPYHIHQLTRDEFNELLSEQFGDIEMYYQRGPTFEKPREDVRYFIGVGVCRKNKVENCNED